MNKLKLDFSDKTGRIKNLRSLSTKLNKASIVRAFKAFDNMEQLPHGYSDSTYYDVIYQGRRYPPKVIFGLAFKFVYQVSLTGNNFPAGEKTSCFITLRRLGFDIVEKTKKIVETSRPTALNPRKKLPETATNSSSETRSSTTDWELKGKRDRELGLAGEHAVIEFEKDRLRDSGKFELASKVKHVALYDDLAGFDILSYSDDGKELFIEVKTTSGDELTPFFISRKELSSSKLKGEAYRVYRLFNFSINGGLDSSAFYQLNGPDLDQFIDLEPVSYIASIKGSN